MGRLSQEIPELRRHAALAVRTAGCLLALLAAVAAARPESNINPAHSLAWSANSGWIDWRPDADNGARISEFVCSAFLYSANLGWNPAIWPGPALDRQRSGVAIA